MKMKDFSRKIIVPSLLVALLHPSDLSALSLFYLSDDSEKAAVEAIAENNLDKLKAIVGTKKSNNNLIDEATTAGTSACFSSSSFSSTFLCHGSYLCRAEIVKFLIDRGDKPTDKSLAGASANLCPEIFEMVLSKLPSREIAHGVAKAAVAIYPPDFEKARSELTDADSIKNANQRLESTVKMIIFENEKRCKKPDPTNINCEALEHLKQATMELMAREKSRQFNESPEGTLSDACWAWQHIQRDQGYINSQNEIGRTTGIVDKKILYDAGSRIVQSKKDLEAAKKKYRSQTGKNLDLKNCESMTGDETTEMPERGNVEWHPEVTLREACEALHDIKREQGYIDEQKEIARTSGVVDKQVLHEAGGIIVTMKKNLEALKREYRSKTGKDLNLNNCKEN